MLKLLLLVMVLSVGSCRSVLRSGGTGGHGGNAGGSGDTGGTPGTGGITQLGGAGGSGPRDGVPATDAAVSSCENPLPLRCGDRLNHNTLVQGRADVWNTYACTQRWMSGREAIYVIQTPTACQVSVQLKNLSAELDIFLLQGCASMSCTSLSGSPHTFAAEAGQSNFLVVDGHDEIAGSYTLEVDCACNQDGGTSDSPPADAPPPDAPPADILSADAPGDTATTLGCDPTVAATAMSTFGIVTVGNSQMLSATLPAVLATDANWGLKASVCKQAGYDITALAGKTVCLLGQDMAQTCQGIPGTAWVVMDSGAVACVYKTVRQGFGATPGVYAVNDANCAPSTIAPGATVSCEGRSCTNATGPCCPATSMMSRVGMCGSGCFVAVTCDGSEDCLNGTVCCSLESAAGFAGASCVSADQCTAPSRVICRQQTDCLASQKCAVPDPMPAYISTYPYAESSTWRVAYEVCAP